ncbi:hypothetical protein OUZ56_023793 [Daphnia magna]|uniref:Uncharacterized protein n=1 Tax=Daphnia magna TaxID=35525 RepID=A0ABR0AZL6_9CRUS|nr:hypothetical protein OUZ56_023793 [Daphnia magna]
MSQNYLKIWGLKQFGAKWDNFQQCTALGKADVYDRLEGEWDFTEPQFIKPFYHLPQNSNTSDSSHFQVDFRAVPFQVPRSMYKNIRLSIEIENESESNKSCEEEQDVARRSLDKALMEKKKKFQNLRNNKGRTVKRRDTDQQQRLTAFKESYKGEKEVPQRNKPWSVLEWQNHWNSLDQRQQENLDRKKSYCHISIGSKINDMAANYTASVMGPEY